jgi:hypothetical protein
MLVCDTRSYFTLCSNFSEIFDVDWFTSSLSNDVKIIKQLPSISKGRKSLSAYRMRVPRKCSEKCYLNRILPVLVKKHVSFYFLIVLLVPLTYCIVQLIILSLLIRRYLHLSVWFLFIAWKIYNSNRKFLAAFILMIRVQIFMW